MSIRVTFEGKEGVHRMLSAYSDPEITKRLKAATKDGAKVFVKPLKSEARPVSRRMANAVKVKANTKDDKPGYHVRFVTKKGSPASPYFKHMVIGGTKSHGPRSAPALVFVPGWNQYMNRAPRARRVGGSGSRTGWVRTSSVRGVKANPMVTRVADRYEAQAWAAFDKSLDSTEAR